MEHLEVMPPENGIRNIKELKKEIARSYEEPSFRFSKKRERYRTDGTCVYQIAESDSKYTTTISGCLLNVNIHTGEIVAVYYSLDGGDMDWSFIDKTKKYGNPIHKNFLRSKIDPNIPNNWDEVHKQKTFTFLVANTTFEKISIQGMDENEAQVNLFDADNTLKDGWKLTPPYLPIKTLEKCVEIDGESTERKGIFDR